MVNINVEEIRKRNEIIDNAIIELKKKYIGVDEQIDEIMNNVRTWYCYPQLLDRPLVVNLWGMSGCSKTDSVRTIAKLLNLEEDLIYFNFADINEKNAWEIESEIEDNIGNTKSNRIIVYDEFQYAATLDKHKEEKDNKGALKPFWELLDTGILNKKPEIRVLFDTYKVYIVLKRIVDNHYPIEIINGVWVNSEKYMDDVDAHEKRAILEVFTNSDDPETLTYKHIKEQTTVKSRDNIQSKENLEFNPWLINRIIEIYNQIHECQYSDDSVEIKKKIYSMNAIELINFFYDLYHTARKGYRLNFKNSIVFVIGNLDEAYNVSFNVNPDMSPDQFHKITKKISVVDIKEALKERFRNEQIARLGNIHIIYPSFSSKAFKGIIQQQLDNYSNEVKNKIGCQIKYDKSINDIIYKEGVFPTHGTRPIFSSIQEIVKSRLPEILKELANNNLTKTLTYIRYSYTTGSVKMEAFDNKDNLLTTIKTKLKLRIDNLRKSTCDDKQALCAVHESGHFVVYASVYGNVPAKLISMATESGTGGFLLQDDDEDDKAMKTFDYYMNNIKIALGGYVAETAVFGRENRTSGAVSDLRKAASIANQMVLELGFYSTKFKSNLLNIDTQYLFIDDERKNTNEKASMIIDKAIEHLTKLFLDKDYRKMLKASSEYLATHSEMPRNKMKEILSIIPIEKRPVINDRIYRDKLKDFDSYMTKCQ